MEQNNIFFSILKEDSLWHTHGNWGNSNEFKMYKSDGSQTTYFKYLEKDGYTYYKSDENNIEYRFNRDGFRTENNNKGSQFILTAGCSNTFGYQLPESHTWPSIMKNEYLKTKNVYNIGITGLDSIRIIRNCFNFIEIYGGPEYLFIILPPFQRTIVVNEQEITTEQLPRFFNDKKDFEKHIKKNKFNLQNILYNNIMTIKNLESFCKQKNIVLKWFCWDEISQEIYEKCNFQNLISSNNFAIIKQNNINNVEYWDWAHDNNHPGFKWQDMWARTFINSINN